MKDYRLDGLLQNALAFDLETHLIQPGLLSPPPVLGSASEIQNGKIKGVLLEKHAAYTLFKVILMNPQVVVCVANGPFDFLVMAVYGAKLGEDLMPEIFAMYDPTRGVMRHDIDGRVLDVQIFEGLHGIAQGHHGKHALTGRPFMNDNGRQGRYSLKHVTTEVTGREDAKVNDRFRLSYAQFDGVPLSALPYEAQTYPVNDTDNTLEDALGQAGHFPSVNHHVWKPDTTPPYSLRCKHCTQVMTPDLPQACMRKARRRNSRGVALQTYFAWAAHLGASWGFNVNQEMVDELEKKYLDMREAHAAPFKAAGIVRDNGTEDQGVLKRLVAVAYGARHLCGACNGTGKVPSPATNGKTKINCKACDGTCLHLPPTVPRAPADGVKKDRDTLQESGDELLISYGEQEGKKILSTYVPLLRKGRACNCCGRTGVKTKYKPAHEEWCTAPDGEAGYRKIPLIVNVNPLVETERSSIEDGLHGLPRKGGVRNCIEARPGYVLSSEDYAAGELVTLAWNCQKLVGWSKLGDALNTGLDAHLALAGTMLGKSYAEMLALKKAHDPMAINTRQATKAANFGFGGGMAELTFTLRKRSDPDCYTPCANGPDLDHKDVRGYKGLRLCILIGGMDRCGYVKLTEYNDKPCPPVCKKCVECAKMLREFWFKQWPEMREFFGVVKKMIKEPGPSGTNEIIYPADGSVRGGVEFCDGANGFFQRHLAYAAKAAFCQIQREFCDRTCRVESSPNMMSRFAGGPSPLFGAGRAILLAHDETVAEHVESVAHEGAIRVSEIMVETLRNACPGMEPAVKADPTLMRRLLKGAEPKYARGGERPADENDRLICWEE